MQIDRLIEGLRSGVRLFDVRSPSEFAQGHIPGAISIPLFSDEERALIGTTYKRKGREAAVLEGLQRWRTEDLVRKFLLACKCRTLAPPDETIMVHCWRGGMRSGAVAWLLRFYGFKVEVLDGGYKSFRSWVLERFSESYQLRVIGGRTGAGKTEALDALVAAGIQALDLENLASHRGSAFGAIGLPDQPPQQQFENELAYRLSCLDSSKGIVVEDESRRIGTVSIPLPFFEQMRSAPVVFLDVPFEERLQRSIAHYGSAQPHELAAAIQRISKKLGGQATKEALSHLVDGNIEACFTILLRYYDDGYDFGLSKRRAESIQRIDPGSLVSVLRESAL